MRVLGNSAGGMPASAGFTLIELMVVLTIVAILTVIGLPSLTDFVAEQRVRTVASDLVSEIVFARVKAVELSRRVIMEQLPGGCHRPPASATADTLRSALAGACLALAPDP